MTPYVLSLLPRADVVLFERIRLVVLAANDIDLGLDEGGRRIQLSCHMLARDVGQVFDLEFVDGFFAKGYQHSWVNTRSGNIIDAYPVGVLGGPLLSVICTGSPGVQLYTVDRERFNLHVPVVRTASFLRATSLITEEILRVNAKLS